MPSADPVASPETDHDRDREREHDREHDKLERAEKPGSKQKSALAAAKAKDLSHVPCKFFKVGGCTAGPSCPFSHSVLEPGAQKEPCAWFVKGNCKFGHKCALAHVLPGQSMSMDRKNKKAAQQAAAATAAAPGTGSDKSSKDGKKPKRDGNGHSSTHSGRHNALLAGGSTAPTRLLTSTSAGSSSNRPPMSLKAPISPSAPAPPLNDTDFASFAALDEMEGVQLPVPPAHGRSKDREAIGSLNGTKDEQGQTKAPSPLPLPTSAPRVTATMTASEFGPIGSPPGMNRSQQRTPLNGGPYTPGTSPRGPNHLNGVNLATSPPAGQGFLSTSPFSAPGTQSVFLSSSYAGGGMPASLGTGLTMMSSRKGWGDSDTSASPAPRGGLSALAPTAIHRSTLLNGNNRGDYSIELEFDDVGPQRRQNTSAVGDGDMEDFIPGSLTDLLTPEERSRRMSRSGSTKPPMSNVPVGGADRDSSATRLGHRYSSSVPAPSLLGDLKSIWSDNTLNALPGSPSAAQTAHRSTSSNSFATRFENLNMNGQGTDDMGLSMSFNSTGQASSMGVISPSNASAAFLGLHHNYMQSKANQQAQLGMPGGGGATGVGGGLSRGLRGASNPLAQTGNNNPLMSNYLSTSTSGIGGNAGLPSSATNPSTLSQLPSYRSAPSPFDLTQPMYQQAARPIPATDSKRHAHEDLAGHQLLSPNSRALHAHAPGQSLPQGLAAGYSRIHALPPLANLASPNNPGMGTFMPGLSPSPGTGIRPTAGNGPNNETTSHPSVDSTTNSTNPSGLAHNAASGIGSTAAPYAGVSGVSGASPGLDSVLSKLTYSAAAGTTRGGGIGGTMQNHLTPPGLSRTPSDRHQPLGMNNVGGGPIPGSGSSLSPLRPRDDDDELFAMDK